MLARLRLRSRYDLQIVTFTSKQSRTDRPRRVRRLSCCRFVVVTVLSLPRLVIAQDSTGYAGVAVMFSAQHAVTEPAQSPDTFRPGIGGNAIGVVGAAGAHLSPRVSLGFELSVPERSETLQEMNYFQVIRADNRHRDLILSGVFNFHYRTGKTVRPTLVAGLSYVREDTNRTEALRTGLPPSAAFGPYLPVPSIVNNRFGATGGADVGIYAGAHFAVLGQGRVHWITREGSGIVGSQLYLSPVVFRFAVGPRVMF
jgi:hypothetical protein